MRGGRGSRWAGEGYLVVPCAAKATLPVARPAKRGLNWVIPASLKGLFWAGVATDRPGSANSADQGG